MSAKIDWYGEKIPSPTDSFCNTCGHQFSDICGGCESLEGVPVKYSKKQDYIDDYIVFADQIGNAPMTFHHVRYGKPKSNADRIRAMSDEELADIIDSDWCAILCNDGVSACDADCHSKILEWLKQEVDG